MQALSVTDHLFLLLESDKQPMNVAGLCLFELPSTANDDFIQNLVKQLTHDTTPPTPPFNQLLKNRAFWVNDEHFDISRHIKHHTLDDGNESSLLAYISNEHARMLNRTRPLWECHIIDGLKPATQDSPNRFAIYLKMHHAMADGVAAMRLFERSLSTSSDDEFTWQFWADNKPKKPKTKQPNHLKHTITSLIKEQIGTIKPVAKELINGLKNRHSTYTISTLNTPSSPLNQRISKDRQILTHSFDKQRFSLIAKHFNASTNDVILAVCSGALRHYLSAKNALPSTPLTAFVPISLRQDDSHLGNQLSFLFTNLATHKSDDMARLNAIQASILDSKNRFARMTQAQIINYSLISYGWAGINLATKLAPTKQAFNLIISNVPSDDTPRYLNGARLTHIFPASVLLDGQALNITLANHQDQLDFGITACPTALPDIEQLPMLIEQQLTRYEQLLPQSEQ